MRSTSAVRKGRVLLAGAVTFAALTATAGSAQAAFTTPACQGATDVKAQGASFQNGAQAGWKTGFEGSNGCGVANLAPAYTGNGSGNGLASMGAGGGNNTILCGNACATVGTAPNNSVPAGFRDPSSRVSSTDEPPTAAQLSNINNGGAGTADDGQVHQIPLALGATAVIVHIPNACSLTNVTALSGTAAYPTSVVGDQASDKTQRPLIPNSRIEAAFAGDPSANTWGKLVPGIEPAGPTCADFPVLRVTRQDQSGTTYGFKKYLALVNATRNWDSLQADNRQWPQAGVATTNVRGVAVASNGCTAAAAPDRLCYATAGSGAGNLSAIVRDSEGTIGYADVATARTRNMEITPGATQDPTFWLPLNPLSGANAATTWTEPTSDPKAHFPANSSRGANCASTTVTGVPTAAASPQNDPSYGDWSQAAAAGGPSYPACVLTYALAWDDNSKIYGTSADEERRARTVKDYLSYIVGPFGQNFVGQDYTQLPASLLKVSQDAVAKIDWNKSAGGGGGTTPAPTPTTPAPTPTTPTPTTPAPPVPTKPSNAFSVPTLRGSSTQLTSTATLPGPGRLTVKATFKSGRRTVTAGSASASKSSAGNVSIRIRLSSAAKRALGKAKSRKLSFTVSYTFTPTGGDARTVTKKVTVRAPKKKK
jgi:ABC-type phosphate transport system substrate-binding protein